jgi:hypothetical protein
VLLFFEPNTIQFDPVCHLCSLLCFVLSQTRSRTLSFVCAIGFGVLQPAEN